MNKMPCSITDGEQEPDMTEEAEIAAVARFNKVYLLLLAGAAINQRHRLNERLADMPELKSAFYRLYNFLQDGLDVVAMYNDHELTARENILIQREAAEYAEMLVEL